MGFARPVDSPLLALFPRIVDRTELLTPLENVFTAAIQRAPKATRNSNETRIAVA
jgi:hypothetical protein